MFGGYYADTRVLVTGHTGFKGAWLVAWLNELGAEVWGFSRRPPTKPSMFDACAIEPLCNHVLGDVEDLDAVAAVLAASNPEVVLHLAGQPLVGLAHADPRATFATNVGGTANVVHAALATGSVRSIVAVTSDKCYENKEWLWGYRENDALGGDDPYGLSKAGAEFAVRAFERLARERGVGLATARAGNVVGGGDWSPDRLVPDLVRALSDGGPLILRRPEARRPWQHVLEPLSGYLQLGASLAQDPALGGSWNFGPPSSAAWTVRELVSSLCKAWGEEERVELATESFPESELLRLDTEKARQLLGWEVVWDMHATVDAIASWYQCFRDGAPPTVMQDLSREQIADYTTDAGEQRLAWTS